MKIDVITYVCLIISGIGVITSMFIHEFSKNSVNINTVILALTTVCLGYSSYQFFSIDLAVAITISALAVFMAILPTIQLINGIGFLKYKLTTRNSPN